MPLYTPILWVINFLFRHDAEGPFTGAEVGQHILAKIAYAGIIAGLRYIVPIGSEKYKVRLVTFFENVIFFQLVQDIPFGDLLVYTILEANFDDFLQEAYLNLLSQ